MSADDTEHTDIASTAAPHPEEMKGEAHFRAGPFSFDLSGRTTPAGLITAAVLLAAILIPVTLIVRRPR